MLLALVTFPFNVLRNSNHAVLDYLLDNVKIADLEQPIPSVPEPIFLLLVLLIKFVGTVLSVGLVDVPCGIYTPIFVIGAVLGRFVGELVVAAGVAHAQPAAYAVCGAAAVAAAGTHTLSLWSSSPATSS